MSCCANRCQGGDPNLSINATRIIELSRQYSVAINEANAVYGLVGSICPPTSKRECSIVWALNVLLLQFITLLSTRPTDLVSQVNVISGNIFNLSASILCCQEEPKCAEPPQPIKQEYVPIPDCFNPWMKPPCASHV